MKHLFFLEGRTGAPVIHKPGLGTRKVIPCRYGADGRNKGDPKHTAEYSHP